ncbi:MAG: MBL fold metallo-hydrolase [Treponema sp.]|jgi:glyoxylase-like metal-dependent hydrolase (beta-lactamase superfamily II)|nr:MBL fold metallo-hydrolase [Treponema sp.]
MPEVKKIGENVYCITERTPENGGEVNAYLVTGTKKAVLIDSLMTDRSLYETVKNITSLPLEVILTHGHSDHAGAGLHKFHEAGVTIYISEKDFYFFRDNSPYGLKEEFFTPSF